jgi:hypothetical protein
MKTPCLSSKHLRTQDPPHQQEGTKTAAIGIANDGNKKRNTKTIIDYTADPKFWKRFPISINPFMTR